MATERFRGKVALVTGASTGIGLATARELVAEGARVTMTARSEELLRSEAERLGGSALAVAGDVSVAADRQRWVDETMAKWGRLDVLIVNAGIARFTPVEKVTEEEFDRLVEVNLKGAFFTVQAALPHLAKGSSIVLVGSNAHAMGVPTATVYAATKAGLRALARGLGAEFVGRGIRVNCVSPGPTDTPIFGKLGLSEAHLLATRAHMIQQVPQKRIAPPRELARVILFLASDDASYVTGHDLFADGGWIDL